MRYALAGKGVLVTGGTGSFGRAFVRHLLQHEQVSRVVVFSRDELKQSQMALDPDYDDPRVRFFLGDVRDGSRLARALDQIQVVIHAAALKQVPAAEYNPFEFIKTNVVGGQNVIDCCLDRGVERVIALSTDKAAAPINLYGATKLCADKLFVAANNYRGARDARFSVVRYGNVLGSRGSVVPFFLKARERGPLPLTDERMTRFSITMRQCVDFVVGRLPAMQGGEIFVPKIPSFRLVDLAEAIAPAKGIVVVGVRQGEKLHEEMITRTDAMSAIDCGTHFIILPSRDKAELEERRVAYRGEWCAEGFEYSSESNEDFLDVDSLRTMIRDELDATFIPST